MKKQNLTSILFLVFAVAAYSSASAVTIDATSTQPTVGADDASSYVTPAIIDNSSYSNNPLNSNGAPGQTFTATSSGNLTAITVQGLEGAAGLGYQSDTFVLYIDSVGSDGTTLTPLGGGDFTFADQSTAIDYSGDYLTFNLSSVISVTAGDEYAYSISGTNNSYYGFSGSTGDVYGGGNAIVTNGNNISSITPATSINANLSYDRNFDAHISAVPEPSTWAMLVGGLVVLAAWQRRRFQA
jgi:hypothetical protein